MTQAREDVRPPGRALDDAAASTRCSTRRAARWTTTRGTSPRPSRSSSGASVSRRSSSWRRQSNARWASACRRCWNGSSRNPRRGAGGPGRGGAAGAAHLDRRHAGVGRRGRAGAGRRGLLVARLTRSLRALSDRDGRRRRGLVPASRSGSRAPTRSPSWRAPSTPWPSGSASWTRLKEAFLASVSHELRSPLTSMREAGHLLRDEIPGGLNEAGPAGGDHRGRAPTGCSGSSTRCWISRACGRACCPSSGCRWRSTGSWPARPTSCGPRPRRRGWRWRSSGGATASSTWRRGSARPGAWSTSSPTPSGSPRAAAGSPIRVVDAGSELEVQVEDTGVGIPAMALPHIFGWYEQAHRQRGGTGLGLPIVRGLVEAHGGRVTVESQEGKGSRFTVLLPARRKPGVRPSLVLLGVPLLLAGCAAMPTRAARPGRPAGRPRRVRRGGAAYDEVLARYPDDPVAPRALAAPRHPRQPAGRPRTTSAVCSEELTAREAELGRIKQDLESLRGDLENLKRLDLREERRLR